MVRQRTVPGSPGATLCLLGALFGTLAHPTRRAIADRLTPGSGTAGELAAPIDVSPPAISRHLRTREASGLVVRRRRGRQHLLSLDPARLADAERWLAQTRGRWDERLDGLARHLEESP